MMSGYRSYVPWNKTPTTSNNSTTGGGGSSTSSGSYASAKKEPSANSAASPKYESSYAKSRSDAKKSEDKSSAGSALGTKYTSAYSSGYQRDTAATRNNDTSTSRSDLTTRIKSPVEKKESHPPVTYRPLLRTTAGARSRDPSPAEREKTESSSGSGYNYSRLYPRQYSRSASREKLDTPATTIPKYTGRSSLNKEYYDNKYGASRNASREDLSLAKYKPPDTRTSRNSSREDLSLAKYKPPETRPSRQSSREDLSLAKYKPPEITTKADLLSARFNKSSSSSGKEAVLSPTRYRSKEDLSGASKYKSEDSSSSIGGKYKKEELGTRYKTGVGTSREDLTKTPQKYITSRFLPKNSIEKSHTAYLRPSSSRTSEVSRKNRELLNVLSAQHDTSRPSSRASTIDEPVAIKKHKTPPKTAEKVEMETLVMVTRSTSPNPPGAQTSYLRRRVDVAKLVERQCTRPKSRGETADKEMQSDRMDDTTKNSRFAGASRIAAAPWSSYLDLKYSSPNPGDTKNDSSQSDQHEMQKSSGDHEHGKNIRSGVQVEEQGRIPRSSTQGEEKERTLRSSTQGEEKDRTLRSSTQGEEKERTLRSSTLGEEKDRIPRSSEKSKIVRSSSQGEEKSRIVRSSSQGEEQGRLTRSSSNSEEQARLIRSSSQSDDKEKIAQKSGSSASSSPRSLSRNNSSKSLSRSSSKSNLKSRSNSSLSLTSDKPKVKTKTPTETAKTKTKTDGIKKQLPPQIPKTESQSKVPTLHSLNTPNKDFRKSVLNMNPESSKLKKHTKRSNSASSAESESSNCEAKNAVKRDCRSPSSSSESSSSSTSADDEEVRPKPQKVTLSKLKKPQSAASSRTSVLLSSADELSLDKSPKPPLSPRVRAEKEGEAKSFLMRALAPVTNFFKHKDPWDSSENTEKNIPDLPRSEEAKPLKLIRRIESGERAWWVEESSESKGKLKLLRRVDSGERAWWLDDKSDVPQGVEVHPVTSVNEDGRTEDGKLIYKIRRNDSQIREWWLESSDSTDRSVSELPKSTSEEKPAKLKREEKQKQKPLRMICRKGSNERSWWSDESELTKSSSKKIRVIRHVDSGEKAWWLDTNVKVPPGIDVYPALSTLEDGRTEEGKIVYKIRKVESGERAWWLDPDKQNADGQEPEFLQKYKIRHIDSGERAWWISSTENLNQDQHHSDDNKPKWWLGDSQDKSDEEEDDDDEDEEFDANNIPLGDRASPEGLETPREENEECGRASPYDNVPGSHKQLARKQSLFISKHTNIDDILGGSSQLLSPLMDRIFSYQDVQDGEVEEVVPEQVRIHEPLLQKGATLQQQRKETIGGSQTIPPNKDIRCEIVKMSLTCRVQYLNDIDPFSYTTNFPDPARPPLHTFSVTLPLVNQLSAIHRLLKSPHRLDDAALQLYKDGDYGSYLDLDASISEQQEEFDGFHSNKKNSIVLRTQLSVRVHTIIEKLLTSEGRELRRALFSLKQIFQEDKDLVHEFVQNDGLACLIKVGSEADQNYQNYILRALGQVMLYVDGMNGVMEHNQTVQWLYTLISSKFRLVVKTALKLLLVFVEYTDSNCMLLIKAIHAVDAGQGLLSWHNIMKLLKDFDSADTELLIYATTLINKCLNGVPDQDTYYDQTDALEEQGIENIIQRYMSKPSTDLDLLQQFQIYEAVLQYEDGEDKGTPIRHLDESIRKTLRSRKSLVDSTERRKSRRHSTGTTPVHSGLNNNVRKNLNLQNNNDEDEESSSSQSTNGLNHSNLNGGYKDNKAIDAGVTPALRRRRERAERQRSFMKEQQENATLLKTVITTNEENNENGNYTNGLQQRLSNGNNILNRNPSRKDLTERLNAANKLDSEENGLTKQSWILYNEDKGQENVEDDNTNENERKMLLQLKKENTVKDLTQKLANQNILHSPSGDDKINRIEGMTGLINKAKEGLAKSKSQANVVKSPNGEDVAKVVEVKKSENELRWEELVSSMSRPLNLCDMDFTDLTNEDEGDILAPVAITNGIPPPPPPLDMGSAPPPPPLDMGSAPPPPPRCIVPSPPVFGVNLHKLSKTTETKIPTMKKNKKTVKLFWKEVRDDPVSAVKFKTGYIWDELKPVAVDTQKLEHLFESRAKDLINKKQQELNKNKEIIVLDPKRSNAINIGMTKLPPPRSIKTAILKMDATIMNREGIEKLLTMLPTEEERSKIQEAQAANPDLPLGSAEQFLLTLASISELPARLRLWAFKLDFENTEREIAEPLMDLKQGLEVLRVNKTFRGILSTLLSIGNFLNGNEVKGFQIEYLSKVPEVKDTVHKHSLLHHLCHIVMEKFPDASDLYSEIGAITRASKVDFDELALNIQRLEADCKASWDHLKLIAKHDGSTMKSKMSDFLADCAERIILLGIIHRRVMNRFYKFLLWLGIPLHQIADTKSNEFCRIVSEFALEYRTTRERVLQQLEKKANHRERNKTRGKMITETAKFRTNEDRADAELRQLLGSDISDVESLQGTLPFRRPRKDANRALMNTLNGHLTDGDDEILESLVKTATKAPSSRTAPRERKRTRHADRKSLKRSRTRENPFGHRDSP